MLYKVTFGYRIIYCLSKLGFNQPKMFFSVKVKGTMSSETRREALTQLNTMEAEMKKATERMKEMEEEKEQARQKERNRQSISTPGSEAKTPKTTPARFGL